MDLERGDLVRRLHSAARRSRKRETQAYLGSPVPVLGVQVPALRAIVSAFKKAHRTLDVETLHRLADSLWRGPTFEEIACAIALLEAYVDILNKRSWRLLDRWAGEATGWGLCDWLGLGPIARLVYREPDHFSDVLEWTKSKNPWRRRIAAYALRDFVYAGELDKPFLLLERLLYDEEFWVQRAVGTWLRECWKRDPRRTESFLRRHVRGLPKVVVTVATERAPRSFRDELRRRRGPDAR